MKLNVAVVGTGVMGQHHLRVYNALDNVNLVGLVDLDEALGNNLAEKYNINYYKTLSDLFESGETNAVSVCTPTPTHFEVAKKCLENDIHVLVEKPITMQPENAKKLITLSELKKLKLMVGHVERYNPAIKTLKENMYKIGRPLTFSSRRIGPFPNHRVHDGNVLFDLAIHDLDIIFYIFGNREITDLFVVGGEIVTGDLDFAQILMKLNDSLCGTLEVNWVTPTKERFLSVTGENGILKVDYINQEVKFHQFYKKPKPKDYKELLELGKHEFEELPVKKEEPLKLELIDFINSIKENRNPMVNGHDGLKALEKVYEIKEKIK